MATSRFWRQGLSILSLCSGLLAGHLAIAQPIIGLEGITEPLPWFDPQDHFPVYDSELVANRPNGTSGVTSLGRPPLATPLSVMLARHRHPAEDGHLDVIVRFNLPLDQKPTGSLHVAMLDANGHAVSQQVIDHLPAAQLFFSYRFEEAMIGQTGTLRVTWRRPGHDDSRQDAAFVIAPRPTGDRAPASAGRIPLTIPNTHAATLPHAPMTVGVPFPRGVLWNTDHLRLVDDTGQELPVQVTVTGQWSRHGSIRWVLCDFTADLQSRSRTLHLEYGPNVLRQTSPPITLAGQSTSIPEVDAGRLRLTADGVQFDLLGHGQYVTLLSRQALVGGFVQKVDGFNFVNWGHHFTSDQGDLYTATNATFEVERHGPSALVLVSRGWFVHTPTGRPFCQYVNRYVLHRDSPVIRLFHTWIYTGDSRHDHIRTMGWRFALPAGMTPIGFLAGHDDDAPWLPGTYLRQHAHDAFAVFEPFEPARNARITPDMDAARPIRQTATGRRAAGVIAMRHPQANVYLGVRHFWQNFPSALAIEKDAITFEQWPRHNRPRQTAVSPERLGDIWRLPFFHEGEVMSLSLPVELTEGPIYIAESGPEPHYAYGRPDSVNAQGVAKTAEMWLYFTPPDVPDSQARRVLRGLEDETLRAIADPAWLARSGAFYEMSARDGQHLAELERQADLNIRSVMHQVERMGLYGKWIHGDLLRSADLDTQTASLYRTFRKAHWGWPFSWLPFVRSGDPSLLLPAQAATRMMTDVAFCHYVSDDMRAHFASLPTRRMWAHFQPFREVGWHNRNLIPWAGYYGPTTRLYVDEAEWLWHAWHLTGYGRARDVALTWARQTKIEHPDKLGRGPITAGWNRARWPINLQKQYLEMYEETFDPWFLAAAHAIADMHIHRHKTEGWQGHPWNTGPREFQRFTGDPGDHRAFYMDFLHSMADWQEQGWAGTPSTLIPAVVDAWRLTGDPMLLRRAAGLMDLQRWMVNPDDTPWYYQGYYTRGIADDHMLQTSWNQKWWGLLVAAMQDAGGAPQQPIPMAFPQHFHEGDVIVVRKAAGLPLTLRTAGAYRLTDPLGHTTQGNDKAIILPADAPAGLYRLTPGHRTLTWPITPPGTPEVMLPASGDRAISAEHFTQYWFLVPEGTTTFTLTFQNIKPNRQVLRRATLWSPDGQSAWNWLQRDIDHDPAQATITAQVDVPPHHAGKLWRITLPGRQSLPMTLDRAMPAVLTHSPDRWIDPHELKGPR